VFDPCLGSNYFQASNNANVRFAGNTSTGASMNSDPDPAVGLASVGNVVVNNTFLDGDEAVEFYRLPGSGEEVYPGNRNVVAFNIITGMTLFGIKEQAQDVTGTAVGRHNRIALASQITSSQNRYYNNTLAVNQAGVAVDIRTGGVKVFNNIVFLNQTGISIQGAARGLLDFNLVAANGGGGGANNYVGAAAPGTHSLVGTNPGFVDFANRDFHLTASSAARDAGTDPDGSLLVPDYRTELGALQDYSVNTSVSPRAWQIYR